MNSYTSYRNKQTFIKRWIPEHFVSESTPKTRFVAKISLPCTPRTSRPEPWAARVNTSHLDTDTMVKYIRENCNLQASAGFSFKIHTVLVVNNSPDCVTIVYRDNPHKALTHSANTGWVGVKIVNPTPVHCRQPNRNLFSFHHPRIGSTFHFGVTFWPSQSPAMRVECDSSRLDDRAGIPSCAASASLRAASGLSTDKGPCPESDGNPPEEPQSSSTRTRRDSCDSAMSLGNDWWSSRDGAGCDDEHERGISTKFGHIRLPFAALAAHLTPHADLRAMFKDMDELDLLCSAQEA